MIAFLITRLTAFWAVSQFQESMSKLRVQLRITCADGYLLSRYDNRVTKVRTFVC